MTGLAFPSTPFRTGLETFLVPDRTGWATKRLGGLDDPVTQEEVTETLETLWVGKERWVKETEWGRGVKSCSVNLTPC